MISRVVVLVLLAAGCGAAEESGEPEPAAEEAPSGERPEEEAPEEAPAETAGDVRCVAYTSCGCWRGCVRVREVGDAEGTVFRVAHGEHAGAELIHRDDCFEGRCFVSCSEDSSGVDCEDGAYELSQTCTGSCAPSQAPYRCLMDADGCRPVDHPL